ncbi:MAG TPA: DUF4394 domain-containing protein [Blastocatellia bacterium]|nr:DUF4394 domain-containing protein [Blastocatellia bacterium]
MRTAGAAATSLAAVTAAAQGATLPRANIYALTTANQLAILRPGQTGFTVLGSITGLNGQEQMTNIDFRPSNNLLYGITDRGGLYVFNNLNGGSTVATLVSRPFTNVPPFNEGVQSLLDFNPVVDAIRLQGSGDTNYAITSNGGVLNNGVVQTTLAYAQGDPNQGVNPTIVGGTYTNNFPGAATTIFFAIDAGTNNLVTIATKTNGSSATGGGQLQTVGRINDNNRGDHVIDLRTTDDLDCFTDQNGNNTAVLIAANRICSIALAQYNVNTPVGQTQTIGALCATLNNSQSSLSFLDVAVQTQSR